MDSEGYLLSCGTVEPTPPAKPEHPGMPAGWVWIAIIVAVAVFDLWAYQTGHDTLSQFAKHHTTKIWKWIGVGGMALLGWHLFFGGPI